MSDTTTLIALVLAATLHTAAQAHTAPRAAATAVKPLFNVVEASIPQLQAALADGRVSSRELVLLYLARIATHEETLNAVMTISRTALDEADTLDRERAAGRLRGPLHGVPIALKDNIHSLNMPTTGGALAFKGLVPPYEATLARNLRDAGAIVIAKTVMTELANWVAGGPTPMPANYSALGGYGMNPYDPRPDPRPGFNDGRAVLGTGGSSSGIGTAASFWAANVGTETSASILSPANQTMLAAIKPTVGRVSRHGVIPITADQDTAGPMARSVEDAAILLGAMEGASPDPNDPATRGTQDSAVPRCTQPLGRDYRPALKRDALKGARIGIPRAFFYSAVAVPGASASRGGLTLEQAALMNEAIEVLKKEGAVIVDPADIPSVKHPDATQNILTWGVCSGVDNRKGSNAECSTAFAYGMKRDFNAWLGSLGATSPIKTLTDLRFFNLANAPRGAVKYGQSQIDISDQLDLVVDKERYEADRARDISLSRTQGLDAVLDTTTAGEQLDALLFPGTSGAGITARAGYPTVIVPFGRVPNTPTPPLPAGFDAQAAPFGVSFSGLACSEPRLIGLAYAFEQATLRRVPPPLK